MKESSRETLEKMIEVTIALSPVSLTAGSVHRIIETSIKGKLSSRTSIQRILDAKAERGELTIEVKTIEKNGFLLEGRHYRKAGAPPSSKGGI